QISAPLIALIWILLLPSLTAPFEGRMLMSCLRFVAVLFPVFLMIARQVTRPSTDQALRLSFASAYGIAVAMYVCNQYMY
ncbi:MAG: hypothetical protein KGQ59_12570, partial [Bdellovibrionales bacterium]|nr:hypothetical protein [Bdellovibrionales bacterium]